MGMWDWFLDRFLDITASVGYPSMTVAFMLLMVNTFISLIFGARSKLLIRYDGRR